MSLDEDNDDNDDDYYYHDYDEYYDARHHIYRYLDLEMRMVERNDPTLTKLEVGYTHNGGYSIPPGDDWAGLGNAIARNIHLKELSLHDNDRDRSVEYLLDILPGLSLNCSIKKLSIGGWNYSNGEVWNYLTQFFKHNHNFECLKVQCNPRLSTHEFTSSLRRFDSLKEFKLNNIPWDRHKDCQDDVIILALTGHTELRKLTFTNVHFGNMFGKKDKSRPCCATLATLLMNPLSNLTKLHLHNTNIDDLGATIIATGLTTNSTLSELIFTCECKITGIGWEAIFAALQSSRCMLAKLVVRDSTFSYAATLWLFAALLRHKTTIKTLSLSDLGICDAGWEALFQPLRDPTFVLETLYLGCSSMTNEVLFALTSALTNNSRLKELILRENDDIIDLVLFSSVLRNPNSALKMLDLGFHPLDDRTLLSFAEALATNSRLKHLIWFDNTSVTSIGYGALVQLLCNKLSIMDTFLSNHILEEICFGDIEEKIPEDLVSLLKLNSENTASQAARLKIIQTHFRGPEINMEPFMDLYLSVKPLAIAWMVRDNNGYPLMRALPSLLEMSSVGKARSKKRPYE